MKFSCELKIILWGTLLSNPMLLFVEAKIKKPTKKNIRMDYYHEGETPRARGLKGKKYSSSSSDSSSSTSYDDEAEPTQPEASPPDPVPAAPEPAPSPGDAEVRLDTPAPATISMPVGYTPTLSPETFMPVYEGAAGSDVTPFPTIYSSDGGTMEPGRESDDDGSNTDVPHSGADDEETGEVISFPTSATLDSDTLAPGVQSGGDGSDTMAPPSSADEETGEVISFPTSATVDGDTLVPGVDSGDGDSDTLAPPSSAGDEETGEGISSPTGATADGDTLVPGVESGDGDSDTLAPPSSADDEETGEGISSPTGVTADGSTLVPGVEGTGDDSDSAAHPTVVDGEETTSPTLPGATTFPTTIPSKMPSFVPTSMPSGISNSMAPTIALTPSDTPSGIPTSEPSSSTDFEGFTSYMPDPQDPRSFVCLQDTEETTDSLDDTISLPVNFVYQLWLDDASVELSSVLSNVELEMAAAVADALLTCEDSNNESVRRRRRLIQGVWSVSADPEDVEREPCDTGCHRMDGRLTVKTIGTTGAKEMEIVCGALEVARDDATMTNIAMSVDGIGAIRYEESSIVCPNSDREGGVNGTDSIIGDEDGNSIRSGDSSDPALGGGASFGIAMAGLIVLVAFMAVARRQRNQHRDYATEAGSGKDMMSLQPTMSSPRNNREYTILADTDNMQDLSEEQDEVSPLSEADKSSPMPAHSATTTKSPNVDLFRFDHTDLPGRLSTDSSHDASEDEDDQGSDTLAPCAKPIQLSSENKKKAFGSSPTMSGLETGSATTSPEEVEGRNETQLASPTYPGLSSLLGAADSDGSTTDEDRSVAQIVGGGVRLLKLSDLEAAHQDDNSSSATSSQDDK